MARLPGREGGDGRNKKRKQKEEEMRGGSTVGMDVVKEGWGGVERRAG